MSHRRRGRSLRSHSRRRGRQRNRWRGMYGRMHRRMSANRQRRTQRRREPHRGSGSFLGALRFMSFFHRLRHRNLDPRRGFRYRGGAHRLQLRSAGLGARNFRRGTFPRFPGHAFADLQSDVVVERAGVRFLVGNAQLRQRLENHVGLDFELAGQLIDTNFTHTITFRLSLVINRQF